MAGLSDARAALERGRRVVLVSPPAVEHAAGLWELLAPGAGNSPSTVLASPDEATAVAWADAAPPDHPVHAATSLERTARLLKEGAVDALAGTVAQLTALIAQSALKLDAVGTVVVAWPEALAESELAALDTLLAEARDARRIILAWDPARLAAFVERHAHRAPVLGQLPVDPEGRPLSATLPARYAIVPPPLRAAAVRDVADALDPLTPFPWRLDTIATAAPGHVTVCLELPSRYQLAMLAQAGPVVVLVTAAQLPYLRSIAAPLVPVTLGASAARARDAAAEVRARIAARLERGDVGPELLALEPLFAHHDPAEVAAALLALQREAAPASRAAPPERANAAWVRVFVNAGRKHGVGASDLVGALVREVKIERASLGKIDVRDGFCLVDVAPAVVERVVRGLSGVSVRGRRVSARVDHSA